MNDSNFERKQVDLRNKLDNKSIHVAAKDFFDLVDAIQ